MKFEYEPEAKKAIENIFSDGIPDFEKSIKNACVGDEADEIGVDLLTPGLSGAAVFKINRLRENKEKIPWIAKAAENIDLIDEERENNKKIANFLKSVPKLVYHQHPRVLYFEFAGPLARFKPKTLRDGYSETSPRSLKELMKNIGELLFPIHNIMPDSKNLINRMHELRDLTELEDRLKKTISPNLTNDLIRAWKYVLQNKESCPNIRTKAHGDLNSGNVLFVKDLAYPVIIDFASMARSKDNKSYDPEYHYPFWDYAKLERDLITRCFLKEALEESIEHGDIINIVKHVCGDCDELSENAKSKISVQKLMITLSALREIRNEMFAQYTQACYRPVLAYSLMKILYREVPDSEFSDNIQGLVAVHAAITLLKAPFENLTGLSYLIKLPDDSISKQTKIDPIQLIEDENYPLAQRLEALNDLRNIDSNNIRDTFTNLKDFLYSYSSKHNRMHLNDIRMAGDGFDGVSFQMLKATSRTLQKLASNIVPPWGDRNGFSIPILTLESYFEKSSLLVSIKSKNVEVWHLPLPPGGERLEVVLIPGGSYKIGSPEYERYRDEVYSSEVFWSDHPECLRETQVPTFAISRYPVSQAQWYSVIHDREFPNRNMFVKNSLLPMHNIRKQEADLWCKKLDQQLKKQLILKESSTVTLPSNEQWEIACRAGKNDKIYSFGSQLLPEYANFYPDANTIESSLNSEPSNQLRESGYYGFCNDWGLSDMHGNVFEWCHSSITSNRNVARGGSFRKESGFCRSAFQLIVSTESFFSEDLGFRICLNL